MAHQCQHPGNQIEKVFLASDNELEQLQIQTRNANYSRGKERENDEKIALTENSNWELLNLYPEMQHRL